MGKLPVALQIYSVRDSAQADFGGTLSAVKDMGYDGVELAGLYGMTAGQIRAALDTAGLPCICAHVPYGELVGNQAKTVADYAEIGCKYIAIPYMTPEFRPSGAADYEKVLDSIRRIGEAAKNSGMTLLYHNHDFEFEKMPDGGYALDYLYNSVSPDLLQTEIDTCWVNVAGLDPAEYLLKYQGRTPIVHLKDFVMQNGDRKTFEFRAVGHGSQDMPSILASSLKAGAEWLVVEQDRSVENTPLQDARLSRSYLKSQGF